jgi:hypothetical protein
MEGSVNERGGARGSTTAPAGRPYAATLRGGDGDASYAWRVSRARGMGWPSTSASGEAPSAIGEAPSTGGDAPSASGDAPSSAVADASASWVGRLGARPYWARRETSAASSAPMRWSA